MHDNSRLVLERITRFSSERITRAIYRASVSLAITAWEVPDEPVPFAEAIGQEFTPTRPGASWGKPWGTTWFHVTGHVPSEWRGEAGTVIEARVDLGYASSQPGFQAEGLIYTPDGAIVKAVEPFNTYVPVDATTGVVDFYVEAASNPDIGGRWTHEPTPMGDKATAGTDPIYALRGIDLALRDVTVWELSRDVFTLMGLHAELPAASTRGADILRALEHAVDAMDPHDVSGTASAGRAALADVLAAVATTSAHRVTAVGHAHIDSAWLWPTRETIRKCARTFSNVLALMDEYPDFVFACSSAQQYAWVKQYYPALFERIRARVAEGRFVPVGGMWVESDTNMVGGEAMARQLVAGQSFFDREFGIRATIGWLPDSFGYSGALPQLLAGGGLTHFLTQKISWNETDVFPHHTFWWEGIDGTRMFTHFPPVDSYNSDLSGRDLARAERQYAEKGEANSSLVPFGYGDGGGGPTREMLASAQRTASLEGSPAVRVGTPESFFENAQAEYAHPPVWSGELYLEYHRGTYTSQARTKQGNRRSEHLLREAELWATTATVRTGAEYPYKALEEAWQVVLLQQFHDILPGSSIAWVHREAERNYAAVAERVEALIAEGIGALSGSAGGAAGGVAAGGVDAGSAVDGGARASSALAFNASPFEVNGVPALGAGVPATVSGASVTRDGDDIVLENGRARFVIDATGRVRSAVEAGSGREAVAPGEFAAELQIFRDTPTKWDAWDIDEHYRRHGEVLTVVDSIDIETTDAGPVVVIERHYGASTIRQEFSLAASSAALDVTTRVDWHEQQKLLKLAFALDVRAERAASEVQFGHIYRATHENTSWDFARFETSAHRWVHVGEPSFGVAVANDSTYGHDITRQPRQGGGTTTLVRQSLLRAPLFPDPVADQGEHVLRSSLTVGAEIADAVESGYRINLPIRTVGAGAASVEPLVAVDDPAIVVEAVKLAEDRSGDVIVRLYESTGNRVTGSAVFGFDLTSIIETDLLEDPVAGEGGLAQVDGSRAALALRPFQVVTLRVRRA